MLTFLSRVPSTSWVLLKSTVNLSSSWSLNSHRVVGSVTTKSLWAPIADLMLRLGFKRELRISPTLWTFKSTRFKAVASLRFVMNSLPSEASWFSGLICAAPTGSDSNANKQTFIVWMKSSGIQATRLKSSRLSRQTKSKTTPLRHWSKGTEHWSRRNSRRTV